ncbi:SDR family oxidoreductase [Actinomyces ruminicola]|nr:SDR family oxidoreductase [Actinomyces ruminicola]
MKMNGSAVISGATGGIGSAIAGTLLEDGYDLVLLGRDQKKLEAKTSRLMNVARSSMKSIALVEVDVGDPDAMRMAAADVVGTYGVPKVIVHAAGDHPAMRLKDTADAQWEGAIRGKLMGAVHLVQSFGQVMCERRTGSIVIISGLFRQEPSPLFPIGSAVNAALGALVKSSSKELAPHGVRINVVDPGPVSTGRWMETCRELAVMNGGNADLVNRQTVAGVPVGRLASPEDVANAVSFLCSDKSSYITGTSITIDGGLSSGI